MHLRDALISIAVRARFVGDAASESEHRPQTGLRCGPDVVSLAHRRHQRRRAEVWTREGKGLALDERLIHHLCWADDTCVFAETTGQLVQCDKYTWQEVVAGARERLADDAAARLSLMHNDGTHEPIRLLCAQIQTKGHGQAEMGIMLRPAAVAYHVRKQSWATRGRTAHKCRMLHATVFMTLAWAAGCRRRCWSMVDLRQVRRLQLRLA